MLARLKRPHLTTRSAGWSLSLAALAFFGVLAFITLYPLIFHNGSRAAGYDWFFPHWVFWWTRHALSTEGLHVYESNYVMAPHTTNYAYNAMALFWFPAWSALEPLVGTLTSLTIITWVACTLNGFLFFVLLRGKSIAPGWCLLGGVALQTFPAVRYFYYNSHINLMNWFLIPALFLIWKVIATTRRRPLAWIVVMGVALWATVLADLQFVILGGFVLGPYVLLTFCRSSQRLRLVISGALAIALALGLLWFAGPLAHLDDTRGTRLAGPVEDRPTVDFPAGFVSMEDTWWDWQTPSFAAFVTVATLVTSLFALARPRRGGWDHWVWLLVAILPLVLATGPTLTIGNVSIPLPYRLLYSITDGHFRMPWRLAPAFALSAMIFVGIVWTGRLPASRTGRTFLLGALFFVLALDFKIFVGGPTQPILPEYETYAQMGADPYDYVVVEIPTGAGSGELLLGDPDAVQFQYYGITHGKRMVNGFVSRAPLEHFWLLHTDDPMLSWLGQRRLLEPDVVDNQLAERIYDWPIGYLVVHQDHILRNSVQPEEVVSYLNSLPELLCAPYVEGDALFYRTRWHPDGCIPRVPPEQEPGVFVLDIGAPGDERYIGGGWHWQETVAGVTWRWAGAQPEALLYLELPPGNYTVELAMQAYHGPRRVRLAVNDMLLEGAATADTEGLQTYSFALPAELVGTGTDLTLSLRYDGWSVPAELGPSQDQRRLAVAVDYVRFTRAAD